MKLRAKVRQPTGATVHRLAKLVGGALIPENELPIAVSVEIVQVDSAFFLFHYDEQGKCVSDTWHATLDEAKAQAKLEFGIEDPDWTKVCDSNGRPN